MAAVSKEETVVTMNGNTEYSTSMVGSSFCSSSSLSTSSFKYLSARSWNSDVGISVAAVG